MEEFAARADLTTEEFVARSPRRASPRKPSAISCARAWPGARWCARASARASPVTEAESTAPSASRRARATCACSCRRSSSPRRNPRSPRRARAEISHVRGTPAPSPPPRGSIRPRPARGRGGRVNWAPRLEAAAAACAARILTLAPGEVTAHSDRRGNRPVPPARHRGRRGSAARYSAMEYAAYYIPGGRTPEALAEAARIAARIDTCDDLYGVAKGRAREAARTRRAPPGEIPSTSPLELAKLDKHEVSHGAHPRRRRDAGLAHALRPDPGDPPRMRRPRAGALGLIEPAAVEPMPRGSSRASRRRGSSEYCARSRADRAHLRRACGDRPRPRRALWQALGARAALRLARRSRAPAARHAGARGAAPPSPARRDAARPARAGP